MAFKFGPAEYFSMMMLGLLAGATLAKGSAIKGVAMVVVGLLLGVIGTDVNTGTMRFHFGILPGTGPTIASFISYAVEKKVAREPRRFGRGAIEGIAGPEAATSASTQTSFIPTMSLGIPSDPVMALMLGALIIHGIQPGPQMMVEHTDMLWGLIASFWVGNVLLLLLNLPLIGMWVRLLTVPFRYLFPAALFFVCVGVYSTNNNLFDVGTVTLFGAAGYALIRLRFEPAPLLLGFVLACVMLIALLLESAVRHRNRMQAALQQSGSAA